MNWSSSWKSSKQPRKQRNYASDAPMHVRSKLLGSHVAKDLRAKTNTRSLRIRKGDKVKIMRGQFKGKTGSVDRVDTTREKVFITGIEFTKKDGSKAMYPIHTSNILIQDVEGSDKRRLGEKK